MASIVFCGTPDFAVPSLRALAADPAFDVQLVITQPDKPVGRKAIVTPPPVKVVAEKLGIPVWQPQSLNKELKTQDSRLKTRPDFLVVVAYGQILSEEVLAWPSIAPINVHASLLPRWRGASPVQHAVLAGDTETGVTIQRMVYELDAGPILGMQKVAIGPEETAEALFPKLAELGALLLADTLKKPLHPKDQPTDGITLCRKLSRDDGNVDPATMTAEDIDRRVRALHPWPGVRATIGGKEIKILRTSLKPSSDAAPLPCSGGTTLYLREVQAPGGKPVTGVQWARGKK